MPDAADSPERQGGVGKPADFERPTEVIDPHMNFFERQDEARHRTRLLMFYFAGAVFLIVLGVDTIAYLATIFGRNWNKPGAFLPNWRVTFYCSAATTGIILLGSAYRMYQLRGGGRAVAEMVSATLVDMDTRDSRTRQLINIVEEMSIASGVPMPELYIMESEPGINAFVAGLSPSDTVMVFTRGALDSYDRKELQGVVGHEFSHIFNGDIRLNIRLMGVLAGIMLISQLGAFLVRGIVWSRRGYMGSRQEYMFFNGGIFVMMLGFFIWLIGSVGLVLAELLQAAVSRQREYLADASSVQFTRDPSCIAHALIRIRNYRVGSRLYNMHAHELRHMCFGETVRDIYEGMFSTHPPLLSRIREVDPTAYMAVVGSERRAEKAIEEFQAKKAHPRADWLSVDGMADGQLPMEAADLAALVASVGEPGNAHLEYAHALHEAIPRELMDALHTPSGARCMVYALFLNRDQDSDAHKGLEIVTESYGREAASMVERLMPHTTTLGPRARMPLIDLAMPALKRMDYEGRAEFTSAVARLIGRDKKVTVFEYVAYSIVKGRLSPDLNEPGRVCYRGFEPVAEDAAVALSALAYAGATDENEASASFSQSMGLLGLKTEAPPLRLDKSLRLLDLSLGRLDMLGPKQKERLLGALLDCVMHDKQVMVSEGELLRAVAQRLGCPIPPLLTGR